MNVLFIILNKSERLDEVLALLVEHGVKGATILDSQGMGSSIVHSGNTDIPMFGSLKTLLKGSHPYNKTIFTVIHNEETLHRVVQAIQELLKDEKKPDDGFMFTLPVGEIFY